MIYYGSSVDRTCFISAYDRLSTDIIHNTRTEFSYSQLPAVGLTTFGQFCRARHFRWTHCTFFKHSSLFHSLNSVCPIVCVQILRSAKLKIVSRLYLFKVISYQVNHTAPHNAFNKILCLFCICSQHSGKLDFKNVCIMAY